MTECTNLKRLHLKFTVNVNLQASQPETFNACAAWLGQCKRLKELELINIESIHGALVPMLLDDEVKLEELTITAPSAPFFAEASSSFNYALAHQTSLTYLDLNGDGDTSTIDQINGFLESMASLVKLRVLELRGVMDNFEDRQIVRLLLSLDQVEEVFTGGFFVTDATLDALVGSLGHLKRWTIMAVARFSADALLGFIARLDEHGNKDLVLSVDMADPEHLLTSQEQVIIRSALTAKVGGTFIYEPLRDPGQSDSEDYSD